MMKFILSILLLTAGALSAQDLISHIQVYDQENAADWSVQTNLQIGDALFGDRPYTIQSIPTIYLGLS